MNLDFSLSYPPFSSVSNIPFLWKYVSIAKAIFTERALKDFQNEVFLLFLLLCPLFLVLGFFVIPQYQLECSTYKLEFSEICVLIYFIIFLAVTVFKGLFFFIFRFFTMNANYSDNIRFNGFYPLL